MDQEEHKVIIKNYTFNPTDVTIKKGSKVTWTNEDPVAHTVDSEVEEEKFESKPFNQGETFSHTFNKVGNFNYYCSIHPQMRGKVIVQD